MKRKALFVGINDYEGGLVPLNCACKDANDLCDYFRDVLRYDTHVLRNADILEVRKKINEVTKDLQRGDVFLFFFAGHGFTVDKGGDTDRRLATARDPKDHLEDGEGGISLRRLRRLTKGGYSRVFILDACQTKINAIRAADDVEKKTVSKRDLSIISSIVKTANEVDDVAPLWVINSCNIGDVAYELENNGLFTWAFIETLMGLRESGEAPVFNETLVSNIANKMRMHPGRFNQTPVFFASDEETPAISVFGDAFSSVDVASMSASSLVLCPICGKKNKVEDTFRCRECGSDNLCLRHQDEKTFLCFNCAKKTMQKVVTVVREGEILNSVSEIKSNQIIKDFNVGVRKKTVQYMLTTFRDGFSCCMGARVLSKHFIPIAEVAYDAGIRWFEIGGGASLIAPFLYCQENTFDIWDSFRHICPDAELQIISQGLNVGLQSQPLEVIKLYANLLKKHGVNAVRNYDALYDPDNLKVPGHIFNDAKLRHEVSIGIMGVPLGMNIEYVHSPKFYVERLRILLDSGMPIDRVCFMDESGTTSSQVVYDTVTLARRLLGKSVHIQFHTHDSLGHGKECCMAALNAGADGLDVSLAPLSGGSCQPDLISIYHTLQGSREFQIELNREKIKEVENALYKLVSMYYISNESLMINKNLKNIPVPHGALKATSMMLNDNDVECSKERLAIEFAECFRRGGCAAAITPASHFYLQQAVMNISEGPFRKFSLGYAKMLLGYFGQLPIAPDPVLVNQAISFLQSHPDMRMYAKYASRSVLARNDVDSTKGIASACYRLQECNLPTTDENILIAAMCLERGVKFLKGEGEFGCRFSDYGSKVI